MPPRYFMEVSGKSLISIYPLNPYRFPLWLEGGDNCLIWMEMKEVKAGLVQHGYQGIVKLRGKVSDAGVA